MYLDPAALQPRSAGFVLEWEQYLKLFKGVRGESAIGEASVSYLVSAGAAAAIRARVPDARILMILRDPADRLRSHWSAARAAHSTTRSFGDWVDEKMQTEPVRVPRLGAIWAGYYGMHLTRFLKHFPLNRSNRFSMTIMSGSSSDRPGSV